MQFILHMRNRSKLASRGFVSLIVATAIVSPCLPSQSSAQPNAAVTSGQVSPTSWAQLIEAAFARRAGSSTSAPLRAQASGLATLSQRRLPGQLEAEGIVRQDVIGTGDGYQEVEGGLSTNLWRNGERGRLGDQSRALAAWADAQDTEERLKVAGLVRGAWWTLQRAYAEADSAARQVGVINDVVAVTNRLVEGGEVARIDLLRTRTLANEFTARQVAADAKVIQAKAELIGLTGVVPTMLPDEVPGALPIDQHPDVRRLMMEANSRDQEARLRTLQAAPNWRVGLDIRNERSAANQPRATSTGFRVSRPIGTAPSGGLEASLAANAATTARQTAQARYLDIEAQRQKAVAELQAARAILAASNTRRDTAKEVMALVTRGRSEGQISFVEELMARTALAEAEQAAATAAVDVKAALSNFNQAQGLLP